MVKTAHGVVSEKRFSGFDRPPNRMQGYWTMYNVAREEGKDIGKLEAPVDSSIPDYFVYELYKNGKMTADSIAKKLRTNVQEVKGIITRQLDVEARLNTVKDELVRGAITKTYEVV